MSNGDVSTDGNTDVRGYGTESNNQNGSALRINNQHGDANNSLIFADDSNFYDSERTQIDEPDSNNDRTRNPVLKTFNRDLQEEHEVIISSPTQRDGSPIMPTQSDKTGSARDILKDSSFLGMAEYKVDSSSSNNVSKNNPRDTLSNSSPSHMNNISKNNSRDTLSNSSPSHMNNVSKKNNPRDTRSSHVNISFENNSKRHDSFTTADTQRILPLSYETHERSNNPYSREDIDYNDTQIIHNNQGYTTSPLGDTQVIRHPNEPTNDTQLIHENDTQLILKSDTQLIPKNDTHHSNSRQTTTKTSNNDTQVIPKQSNNDIYNFESDNTRVEGSLSDSRKYGSSSTPIAAREPSNSIFSPDSQTPNDKNINKDDELQIPRTTEKAMRSTTQVVNTQEESTINDTFEHIDLGTKPVYSSSSQSGTKHKKDDMIVQSDEEEIKDMIENHSGLIYDDSILRHRQSEKKRKNTSSDKSVKKSIKIELREGDSNNSHDSDPSSEFDVISESHIASPPNDQEHVNANVTTPDTMNILEPANSKGLIKTLPSSPTTMKDVSAEVTDLSQSVNGIKIDKMDYDISRASSDLEDFDETYRTEENVNTNENDENDEDTDNVIITRNRSVTRRNYVAQSQTDSSKLDQNTSRSNELQSSRYRTQSRAASQTNPQQSTSQGTSQVKSQHPSQPIKGAILREEMSEALTQDHIVNPDSVFASYKFKIYTGVVTRKIDTESSTVKFSEGEYDIKNSDLFLLDIRIGDQMELRGKTVKYIVTGLSYSDDGDDIKCMRGFNYVYLTRMPTKSKTFPEFSVPLSDCSMEFSSFIRHQQFNKVIVDNHDILKDNFMSIGELLNSIGLYNDNDRVTDGRGAITPPIENQAVTEITDTNGFKKINSPALSSRVASHRVSPRKQKQNLPHLQQHQQRYNQSLSDQQQLVADTTGKLFSETLFLMTSIDDDEKQNMIKLIVNNGGVIIEESLSELLQYFKPRSGSVILQSDSLKGFKFGAIIASSYCRSAKYLQGLALGWPILSRLFIYDCVEDPHKLDHWPMYLLPAGQSSYLQSIKSLDVYRFRYNYEVKKFVLASQLQNNTSLLRGYTIMMLSNNYQNVATLETCEFIFYCFGVGELIKFSSCDQMLRSLEELCGDSSKDVQKVLIYTTNEIAERQLKCDDGTTRSTVNQRLQNLAKVGVVNWEWVVQCVISQYIWEPRRFVTVTDITDT